MIPPGTPQHNGRVERSHRTDNEDFYAHLEGRDPAQMLEAWLMTYNELREHSAIGWLTPFKAMEKRLKRTFQLNYRLVR